MFTLIKAYMHINTALPLPVLRIAMELKQSLKLQLVISLYELANFLTNQRQLITVLSTFSHFIEFWIFAILVY